MNDSNYQRMVEEILEEYETTLAKSPEERQKLEERIAYLRRASGLTGDLKNIVRKRCYVAGTDNRPLDTLVAAPKTESYLFAIQEEIFRRVAVIERAMELSGLSISA